MAFLKATGSGFQLRKSHKYFEQCMGQLGLTGARWCDFFVLCEENVHCERILFDEDLFRSMKQKLDNFYINFFPPAAVNVS